MAYEPDRIGDSGDEVNDVEDDDEGDIKGTNHLEPSDFSQDQAAVPFLVKRRIKSLKKLLLEATKIEAQFYQEVHKLECKYSKLYKDLYDKREQIVTGLYEPTEEECDFVLEGEEDSDLSTDGKTQVTITDSLEANPEISGIPDFWLTVLKNVSFLNDMIYPYDEPILKSLLEIKVVYLEDNPMGFILEFYFGPNDYFSNSVLTKEYEMSCCPEDNDPFSFEGPEIVKCKGCVIDWKKGKNITVKTLKRKIKNDPRGLYKTKVIPQKSFFNFFSPPYIPDDQVCDIDEETRNLLTGDFEIGHYMRERVIPRAILYYTGEVIEDEEEYEDDDEEDDDDDDDDEDTESKQ